MRKAEEIERFRLPESPGCPVAGGEPPELDQPGLLRMQSQPELCYSFAKLLKEPLGVITILETDDEVVGEPHGDHVTVSVAASPLPGPAVEHVVEVNVSEQRRN